MPTNLAREALLLAFVFAAGCSQSGADHGGGVAAESTGPNARSDGGASWSCSASQYHGAQYWTCANGVLNKCDGSGKAEQVSCGGAGCKANPAGVDDQCNWSCGSSQYQGNQYWTCANGNLFKCDGNGSKVLYCGGLGCKSNPAGIDDQCYQPSPGWMCGSSRGSDGNQWLTCSGDGNVHKCVGEKPIELVCAGGCNVNPPNTDDSCKLTGGGGGAPTNARAAAANGSAVVRWSASGVVLSGFTVTSTPGNLVAHAGATATQATVGGLSNGVVYSFAVSQDGGAAAHTNSVRPDTDAHIILDVAHHAQTRALTCEEAALVMALSHERIIKTEDDVLSDIGIDWTPASWDSSGNLHWGDPYAHFVGSPDGDEAAFTGYGTYAPPIARAATDFGATVLHAGLSLVPQTIYDAILSGHPVVAWVTTDWSNQPRQRSWITDDGTTIGWYGPHEHAVTLVGVERDWVLVDNPLTQGEWQRVAKSTFEASYSTFGDMAVVLD